MTTEMWNQIITKGLLYCFAALGSYAHINFDQHMTMAIASDSAALVIALYSFWRAYGSKLVPHNTIAIAAHNVASDPTAIKPGAVVGLNSTAVKVVGCLLALAMVYPLYMGSAQAAGSTSNILSGFQKFTISDAQSALADAQSQTPPDADAVQCWSQMVTFLQAIKPPSLTVKVGVFQALQQARDAQVQIQNVQSNTGPIASLKHACANVILDTQDFLIKLGISGAGAFINPLKIP